MILSHPLHSLFFSADFRLYVIPPVLDITSFGILVVTPTTLTCTSIVVDMILSPAMVA